MFFVNELCFLQVRVSKEYSERHAFYDKAANLVSNLMVKNDLFNIWMNFKLRSWQYEILKRTLRQTPRKILWVVDTKGNNGKSFLARYLAILYGFQLLDGIVSTRDLGPMLDRNARGIVFDVSRSGLRNFDYETLEAVKNGVVVSSKYSGQTIWIGIIPVIVFANFYPQWNALSEDRWDVVCLGENPGQLSVRDRNPRVAPGGRYPFVPPPPVPDLSENFDLRAFLDDDEEEEDFYNSSGEYL